MRLGIDRKRLAPFWFLQPTIVSPRRVWLWAAFGGACLSGVFLRLAGVDNTLRVSPLVLIVVFMVAVVVTAWTFLRYQHRAFALMQQPGFGPRFAGSIFRLGFGFMPVAVAFALQSPGTLATLAPVLIMVTMMGIGASMMYAGSVRRVGDEQVCAACGYECRTSSERCSECGSYWRKPGGLLRGHRVVQPAAIAAGAMVVLIGMVGAGPTRFRLDRMALYLMPDNLRIRAATTGEARSSEGKLQDLLNEQLSREEEELLATCLLEQRRDEQRLSATATAWLEPRVLTGSLPEPIRERFFAELLELWLEGPDTVTAGKPFFPVIAFLERNDHLVSTVDVHIYFAGVSTDGGRFFAGRSDHTYSAGIISKAWYYRGERFVDDWPNCVPQVSIDTPGEHEMTVRMWLAAVPGTGTASVQWRADGSPDFPPTVLWSKEIVLQRSVSVEPP